MPRDVVLYLEDVFEAVTRVANYTQGVNVGEAMGRAMVEMLED